ncbi:MAG: succinate dehydrogenase, hydrophobic membrane anchor protein [Gammaproteobacteria bacterium]|nr:succinate dehydrogenase, hydrophobic membrane anchor protein [Gammaproteobacteria bacterium]MDD9894648.1 succinate dehydrogenase, hydrophobic membrane anchor protein [Gammaproteobacteria bacterium]MDD9960095.1 succinate dehydrogenase, hydrophobic membrane anchor protein [Gammaproteobacteria bacterium]
MVTSVTNLSRSGLSDWIIQRVSAVLLAAYTLCILGSLALNPEMNYASWRALFDSNLMRIFSLITLAALCAHAWIGMWTVSTDYMTSLQFGKSATFIRVSFQIGIVLIVAVYLIWGVQIFWSS